MGRIQTPKTIVTAPLLVLAICLSGADPSLAGDKIPVGLRDRILQGQSETVIVLFDQSDGDAAAAVERHNRRLDIDDESITELRRAGYDRVKRRALLKMSRSDFDQHRDFSHLPMAAMRVHSLRALELLAGSKDVVAIFPNEPFIAELTESLPLTHQTVPVSAGILGTNTSIAILDTGVNYTNAAFGSCTAPGQPSTCKVAVALDTAPDDNTLDSNGHGTNVAAVAAGVAPNARLIAIDVFTGGTAWSTDVADAINWAIANRATYNIVAINMSFGENVKYTSPCTDGNPFRQAIISAKNAGIVTVTSAGNEGFLDGLPRPACTPEAVSVGAVYDASVGSRSWSVASGTCSDASTAANKVACFSNAANFLTMWAPGALISAAGVTYGGTSQAAPHVAGAVALLRSAFPSDTPDQTMNRLLASGVAVTDNRTTSPITKPRLDLASFNVGPEQMVPALPAWSGLVMLAGMIWASTNRRR